MCVCVCVREREREREGESFKKSLGDMGGKNYSSLKKIT